MKKILYIFLIFLLTSNIYALSFTYNNVIYGVGHYVNPDFHTTYDIPEGEAYVAKFPNDIEELVIPPEVEFDGKKYTVTDIVIHASEVKKEAVAGRGIKKIVLPNTIKKLDSGALYNCRQLEEVNIPASLVTIERNSFPVYNRYLENPNASLKKITVDENNPAYENIGGALIDKNAQEILVYPQHGENNFYIIPKEIKEIQTTVFQTDRPFKIVVYEKTYGEWFAKKWYSNDYAYVDELDNSLITLPEEVHSDYYKKSEELLNAKKNDEALAILKAGAEAGNMDCQYMYGSCFEKGIIVEKNIETAKEWFLKAAEQGYAQAQSLTAYYMFKKGSSDETVQNVIEWYEKAAEQNNAAALSSLGTFYLCGVGCKANVAKAFQYFKKAAKLNEPDSQYQVGYMYETGEGCLQDTMNALIWYGRAAQQGNTAAEVKLSLFFFTGTVLEKDDEQAFLWMKSAADANEKKAMKNLGFMYENGIGTNVDYEQAKYWYNKAIENGDKSAEEYLNNISSKIEQENQNEK